jgi:hypothetical protein
MATMAEGSEVAIARLDRLPLTVDLLIAMRWLATRLDVFRTVHAGVDAMGKIQKGP